jgi:hypothetical protein
MTGGSGIDNVDDLLAVVGVDVFFIGPDDLTKNGVLHPAAPRSHLCLTTINSNLFESPTHFDYCLAARSPGRTDGKGNPNSVGHSGETRFLLSDTE